jgi:hypothetical protein
VHLSKASEKKLINSLLSPPYKIGLQLLMIFGIGICPNLFPETDRGLDPFLLLVTPAWIMLILSSVWPFLHTPRKDEWETVLGIDFTMRKQLATKFVNKKMVEGSIILLIGFSLFCLLRFYRMEVKSIDGSMQIGLISFLEIPMTYILMNIFMKFADNMPTRTDWKRKEYFDLSSERMSRFIFGFYKRISCFLSQIANPSIRPILRRHWLYTVRFDFFTNCILTLVFITAAFISNFIATAEISIIVQMFSSIVTCFLLTASFDEANKSKVQCHFYDVEDKKYAFASLLYLLQIIFPFFIATMVAVVHSQQNRMLLLINVVVLYSVSILSFGIRWNYNRWDNKSKVRLVVLCFFVFTSLLYALDKKLVLSLIVAITCVGLEVFDFLKYFKSLRNVIKFPKKIILSLCGFVLIVMSVFWTIVIFIEPLFRPEFINTAAERPVVLSVNSFYLNDSLISISQQFKGYWNLNYDKNIEPKPWIIKDSSISIYDEDNGTRVVMVAKMFIIGEHYYVNCHTLPNKSTIRNQYAKMVDLPINTLFRLSINNNGILNVSALNPFALAQIIESDSLSATYTMKANKYVFIYSENEWLNFLKKYVSRDDLFALMGSFTRVK